MAASHTDSEDEGLGAFLEEPEGFRPATPPPTVRTYKRRKYGGYGELRGSAEVEVGLVSGHPLWGHILYPAAIALAQFLELHASTLLHAKDGGKGKNKGKNVLELGAGGGLPGLVAALEGAGQVVISDFPDAALVKNLEKNVELNIDSSPDEIAATRAAGFTWGSSPEPLFASLSNSYSSKFDLILLSDLVFNHSQHLALLKTCLSCLSSPPPPTTAGNDRTQSNSTTKLPPIDLTSTSDEPVNTPAVLCFFSHHRPKFVEADLQILSLAKENGWEVRKVWEDKEAGPAFPEDDGDLTIRGTVHGFMFTRSSQ
ncbi:uncharacterized protein JCM6883_004372 [Sporobolomyces salmoneus]|uniref:uncharacterized protein n=1 Tax=Sporobolomyces salmoneus TaxID=183962 RepID=UPI003180EAF0